MSVSEGDAPCETDLTDTVNADSVSVSAAESVQNTSASLNISSPSCHVEDTLNDSELLKGLLTDTFCQVCEAVLLFESQRVSHYEGKKHAQRVRIYLQTKKAEKIKQRQETERFQCGNVDPEKFCELCNMVFSSPVVARSHYEGKVHAKNMRKSDTTTCEDIRTTASPVHVPLPIPVPVRESAGVSKVDQGQKESAASSAQEVDLGDPDKYCKLCTASFNNPVMAQQHYIGRKHQRNQTRQEMLSKLSSVSEDGSSLTCPVCCVTLSSVETYQAHMQGNKHHIQEKKIAGLCKSQKKAYNSFQDELADYIQVQKARGLEPKTGSSSEAPGQRKSENEENESGQFEDELQIPPFPSSYLPPAPPLPPSTFRPPLWRPPFQARSGPFGFRGRFPGQHQWNQGYPVHPPPLIPGFTGRQMHKKQTPDSFSSSSSSSSSYSSSSSSDSDSSSDSSRDRRRRKKKLKEQTKRRREQYESDSEKDERRRSKRRRRREGEEAKKASRQSRMSCEEEQGADEDKEWRKWKEKKLRDGDSSEEEEGRRNRRGSKKRHKEGHGKRRREEEEIEGSKESVEEGTVSGQGRVWSKGVQVMVEECVEERSELKEERPKRKKEKKKAKEKMEGGDNRTEEEKLWDETILGIF